MLQEILFNIYSWWSWVGKLSSNDLEGDRTDDKNFLAFLVSITHSTSWLTKKNPINYSSWQWPLGTRKCFDVVYAPKKAKKHNRVEQKTAAARQSGAEDCSCTAEWSRRLHDRVEKKTAAARQSGAGDCSCTTEWSRRLHDRVEKKTAAARQSGAGDCSCTTEWSRRLQLHDRVEQKTAAARQSGAEGCKGGAEDCSCMTEWSRRLQLHDRVEQKTAAAWQSGAEDCSCNLWSSYIE